MSRLNAFYFIFLSLFPSIRFIPVKLRVHFLPNFLLYLSGIVFCYFVVKSLHNVVLFMVTVLSISFTVQVVCCVPY